jgi:anthranilate phosphoribosyltransferase
MTTNRTRSFQRRKREHAFAQYIRILGKGKKGSRSLTSTEARDAFTMILNNEVDKVQLGAFLMLLRVKEETAEEIAAFVEAVREQTLLPEARIAVDLDWPSYAGKKRQLPWYFLSAQLLASSGTRVFMHGSSEHTEGRLYTEQLLDTFNMTCCHSWDEVDKQLGQANFAFMPLASFSPKLEELIHLRNYLGLRSPVHTLVKLINPLNAPYSIQSIFHPAYGTIHQQAAALLANANTAVFKGEGGEIERKPEADCTVRNSFESVLSEEKWPRLQAVRQANEQKLDATELVRFWQGEIDHPYGRLAVLGTTAIALKLMGKSDNQQHALQLSETLWEKRQTDLFA